MKKSLLLALGLVFLMTLSACGSKTNDWENVWEWNVTSEEKEVITAKSSLTIEDLNTIDEELLPESYTYQVYQDGVDASVDSWSYVYPSSEIESLLIPEHENMSNRRIISSNLEDGFIYTVSEVTLKDGSNAIISYVNDPDSLKYLATIVETSGNVVLYNFNY